MKRFALIASFCLFASAANGQSITIGTDGIVRCKGVSIGSTQIVNGDLYEVVDRSLLSLRRNEGKDLTKVCVSNVENMGSLFQNSTFNQPIGNWDVSSVTNMGSMFQNSTFNQPIGNWDVSNVTYMWFIFQNSTFNQPIGNWDVSSVKEMSYMFDNSLFNQPIDSWDVSSVENMYSMFRLSKFNQPIGSWDVGSVTNMEGMFDRSQFNQPIGRWNVSKVTKMYSMFSGDYWSAKQTVNPFNQPIGDWDIGSVENMQMMFVSSQFDQSLQNWCVLNFKTKPSGFAALSPLSKEKEPIWGTCGGVPLPVTPAQLFPLNNSTSTSQSVELMWSSDTLTTGYYLQIYEGPTQLLVDSSMSLTA